MHQSKLLEVVLLPRFCCCRVLLYVSILDCLSDMFLQPLSVFFFTLCVRATLAVRVQFACGVEAPLEACYILYICLFKNQSLR